MLKLWLRRIHLCLAVVAGLFIVISSFTGALLTYAKIIQHELNPDYWQIAPQNEVLIFDKLITKVEAAVQQKVILVEPAVNTNLAWQLQLANKRYVSVNPYNGDVLLEYDYYETFYGFTMAFHRWLLYRDKEGEFPLKVVVSFATLCLIVELILGFYLWVRPKNRMKRLKIAKKAKPKIFFYQLHTVIGVYVFIPLILIAFSGIAFYWKTQTAGVVEALTFGDIEKRPSAPIIAAQTNTKRQLSVAINNGLKALPDAQLFRIYMAKSATESMALRLQMPGETHAYSWVWLNPYTAEVLQVYDGSKASFATQVWNFKYKFHIGDFAGPIVQFLWIFLAMMPVFFTLSGFYLWFCRHNRLKR